MDPECIRAALRERNHRNLERVQALELRVREHGRLTRDESITLIDALEAANAAFAYEEPDQVERVLARRILLMGEAIRQMPLAHEPAEPAESAKR